MELVAFQKFLPDLFKGLKPHAIAEEGKEASVREHPALFMRGNQLKLCGFQGRWSFKLSCRGTSQAKMENFVAILLFLPLLRDKRLKSYFIMNDLLRLFNGKEQAFHFKLSQLEHSP